jgi:hypothetical protein
MDFQEQMANGRKVLETVMDSYGNAEHTDSVPVVKFLSGFISKGKTQ